VELDGAFGPPKLRPVEDRQAKIDGAGVQAVEGVLETEFPLVGGGQGLAIHEKMIKNRLVQFPRPIGICVSQG